MLMIIQYSMFKKCASGSWFSYGTFGAVCVWVAEIIVEISDCSIVNRLGQSVRPYVLATLPVS
jgi:hypothetical protein